MKPEPKITTGLNDRPRNETIAQTGEGLPDDTSQPIEASDAEIAAVRAKLGLTPEVEDEEGDEGSARDAGAT